MKKVCVLICMSLFFWACGDDSSTSPSGESSSGTMTSSSGTSGTSSDGTSSGGGSSSGPVSNDGITISGLSVEENESIDLNGYPIRGMAEAGENIESIAISLHNPSSETAPGGQIVFTTKWDDVLVALSPLNLDSNKVFFNPEDAVESLDSYYAMEVAVKMSPIAYNGDYWVVVTVSTASGSATDSTVFTYSDGDDPPSWN